MTRYKLNHDRKFNWHRWFAWHPVEINETESVWWEWVERKLNWDGWDTGVDYREVTK